MSEDKNLIDTESEWGPRICCRILCQICGKYMGYDISDEPITPTVVCEDCIRANKRFIYE